jgi:uncharacterized protein
LNIAAVPEQDEEPAAFAAEGGHGQANRSCNGGHAMATTAQHVNVERTRRAYEAFGKGDMATLSELLSEDTVWHIGGKNSFSGDYKGRDAVFAFFAKLMAETGGTFHIKVHDILANEEHGVTLVNELAERKGMQWDGRSVHITHLDSEGRTKEFWAFQEDQEAADRFFA